MDKEFTIAIHQGEDYIKFHIGKKESKEYSLTEGRKLLKLLKAFIDNLVD